MNESSPPSLDVNAAGIAQNLALRGAQLAGLNFNNQRAQGLDLREADLQTAQWQGARFDNCRFEDALMHGLDASGATLRLCSLDRANASSTLWVGACIEDCSAKAIDLGLANLCGAKLSETSFERATLCGALLDGASGDGIVFRGADLSGASLLDVRFEDADFRGANLQGARISGVLSHADFRGDLLDGVDLTLVDVRGALFDLEAAPAARASSGTPPFPLNDPALQAMLGRLLASMSPGAPRQATAPSELLRELMQQIGVPAPEPAQTAALQSVMDEIAALMQQSASSMVTPEALVEHFQALLEKLSPGFTPAADGASASTERQALTEFLTQLQSQARGVINKAATRSTAAP